MSKFTIEGNKIDFHCRFCGTWSPFDSCCEEGDKADKAHWESMCKSKQDDIPPITALPELNEYFR